MNTTATVIGELFDTDPPFRRSGKSRFSGKQLTAWLALLAAIVAWVPLAVLAAVQGLASGPTQRESLLLDVETYTKYLLMVPLLVLAEGVCLKRLSAVTRHFVDSGIIDESERPRYQALIEWARRLLGSRIAKVAMVLIAYAAAILVGRRWSISTMSTWMAPIKGDVHVLSLAGWWRILVSQPLFLVLVLQWLWRLLVWGLLLRRISRLNLRLVASHPDLAGGLNFLANSLRVFPILALALGCGLAGIMANEILYGGKGLTDFIFPIVVLVITVLVLFVSPLLSFAAPLFRLRERGALMYGRLATSMGAQFEQKWIAPAQSVHSEALKAPDFSATIDLYSIVSNLRSLRTMPMDWRSVAALVIAALVPLVPVVLISVPFDQVLQYAAKLLF